MQVIQIFCDYLDLFLIWNKRPQTLRLTSRRSSWKTVSSITQGISNTGTKPSSQASITIVLLITLMEGGVWWAVGCADLLPREFFKSRLTDQEERKCRESDCSNPAEKVLGDNQEMRSPPGGLLIYLWSFCLDLHFTDKGKQKKLKSISFLPKWITSLMEWQNLQTNRIQVI